MELLLEISNIPEYHSLYMTLLISLMVKFVLIWNIDNCIISSIYETDDLHLQSSGTTIEMKRSMVRDPLLNWISKIIRRKEGSGDDSDAIPSDVPLIKTKKRGKFNHEKTNKKYITFINTIIQYIIIISMPSPKYSNRFR